MEIETIRRVTRISTDLYRNCEHCNSRVGWSDFAASINHYISAHSYRLLHVGTETTQDRDGKPWQTTVAILGCDNPPLLKELPHVEYVFKSADEAL